MKKYAILTSLLALSACGGGSGGGGAINSPTTPTGPVVSIQGFDGATTVNSGNTELTNMSSYTNSYTTSENASKQQMIDYVNSHLGNKQGGLLNRASSRRASSVRTSIKDGVNPEEFAVADAAISQMKQVVHDIVVKGEQGENELSGYVTQYKDAVVQALILLGQNVNTNMSTDELINAFDTVKQGIINDPNSHIDNITSDNVMAALDYFDERFGITRERMDNVRLKGAGQESYFSFKLDDTGRIEKVSLFEMPELGDNDDGKEYVWVAASGENPGHLDRTPRVLPDAYQIAKEGWFVRGTGNTSAFSNTMYEYVVTIGNHPYDDAQHNNIRPDDLATVTVWLPTNLNLNTEAGKTALKEAVLGQILKEGNKVFTEQNPESAGAATDIVQWYYSEINDDFDNYVDGVVPTQINSEVSMTGAGKDIQLKYADFGYFKLDETKNGVTETLYTPYAGGYDTRRADLNDADTVTYLQNGGNGTTFSGTAIAAIEHTEKINGQETKHDMLVRDTGASLEFKDGVHTLTMNNLKDNQNNDWYRVVVAGQPGTSLTYQFYDTNTDNSSKNIPTEFQFFTAAMNGANMDITANSAISNQDNMAVNTKGVAIDVAAGASHDDYRIDGDAMPEYYGANTQQPDEATTRFSFSEEWHNGTANTHHNEIAIYGAFGGHKDD